MAFDKNDDVLGQIFDFIFAQQELPPDKRKPVEPTGVSGQKELIDAVAAVLENPAKFNVELMADNYADAVNIKLAELRFSEDNIKSADVGISNVVDIVRDPVAYARKERDTTKAIRKSMTAKYLGASATEFVVSAYLRKQGFSKELRDIIKNDTRFRDAMKEMYEFSDYKEAEAYAQGVAKPPMLSGADKEYLKAREAKLLAKLSMDRADWEGLTDTQKNRITRGVLSADNATDVRDTFRRAFGTNRGDTVFRRYQENQKRLNKYSKLEAKNLEREMSAIRSSNFRNGNWTSEEAELSYERTKTAKGFIENSESLAFISGRKTSDLLNKSRRYMNNITNQIDHIKNDLRTARRTGDRSAQRVLKERLKMAQSTKRTMIQVNVVGNIGMIEGYFNSIKDYWNLPSVIKGDFFNPKKNQLNAPTEKIKLPWDKEGSTDGRIISEIMIPAYHKRGDTRELTKAYDEFFARVYYFTPGSILKTFFYNGEGFAWKAYQQKMKIESFLRSANLAGFDLNKFTIDRQYRDAVLSGAHGITNQRLLDMLNKYAKQGDLAKMFSTVYRLQQDLLEKIDEKIIKGFRERLYRVISKSRWFSNLSDGSVATGLLKNWAKNGGLRNLIKGLSQAVAEVLGITAGPGLNFIIGSVVGWVVERLYDLAVPLFGVIVYAIFGVIGVIVMAYGLTRRNNINYNISASTPPGSVRYCDYNDPGFYDDPTDEFWGTPVPIPPPNNSSCPFGDASYGCSQGYTDTTCTHARITHKKPVDVTGVTYFYAPQYCNSSNCTASTVVNPPRCADGNYTGQWVTFNDGNGNVFTLGHTKFIPPSNGSNYKAGEPVAYVYKSAAELIADDPEQRTSGTSFYCWTGSHIHFLIAQNGSPIDPLAFLADMGCTNGPSSEAGCPSCVGSNY
jgi:predicted transcriptional regulator